jgi:hypothetical protein
MRGAPAGEATEKTKRVAKPPPQKPCYQ